MRTVQEPEVRIETGPMAGEVSTHPAYGQISASRVSGTVNLYGSDFTHNHFIAIRINASEVKRSLSHDWHHPKKEYIEVYLSEAQWATFVSSLNQGSGPCCTIAAINMQDVPQLPAPKSRAAEMSGEIGDRLDNVVSAIRSAVEKVDGLKVSKAKAQEVKDDLHQALMNLTSNLKFVAESFDEHAEKTVEKAKAEVHGYMTGMLMRAGIQAIESAQLPLAIEHIPQHPTGERR